MRTTPGQLFKTVTSDNGSEFAGLHDALQDVANIYFSHPYASWERGTSENQHKLIRRFIPKGSPIGNVSENQILRIQRWMNDYPRKILGYATPHDTFVQAFRQERLTFLQRAPRQFGRGQPVGRLPCLSSLSRAHSIRKIRRLVVTSNRVTMGG
uniref:IS30 family transposase n=1 Tax=Enterococcus faecium TaxID=1352 RepID=UPI0021B485E7|nr:IS30 family transposase [Enterococcus faecium]